MGCMNETFFSNKRKEFIADKFGNIGTAIIIAFVIGEFLSAEPIHYTRFIIGFGGAIVLYYLGTIVTPKN
jgi:hypothetical protein